MGIPIEKDVMDSLLNLSKDDKIELIATISGSMVESNSSMKIAELSARFYYNKVRTVDELTDEEWRAKIDRVAGSWSDMPDDIAEQIIGSRTVSDREIDLDD